MAGNTSKEVDLIIRAKNEASKNLDAVAGSVKGLSTAQKEAGQSAKGFDSLLSTLGSNFKQLGIEAQNLARLSKVTGLLDSMSASVARLSQSEATAAADAQKLATAHTEAAAAMRKAQETAADVGAAFTMQKSAVAGARKELRDTNTELASTVRALERVEAKAAKTESSSPWSNAAQSAVVFMKGEVASAQAAAEAAAANVKTLEASLAGLTAERKKTTAEARIAGTVERDLAKNLDKATESAKQQAAELAQGQAALAEMKASAATAASQIGAIAGSQTSIAEATAKVTAELEREKAVLAELSKYSQGSDVPSFADPKLAAQIRAVRVEMDAAKASQQTLQAEAKRLAQEMKNGGGATEQQTAAFKAVTGAASAAKTQFTELQASLARMQGSAQGSIQALNTIDGGLKKIRPIADPIPQPPGPSWTQFFSSFNSNANASHGIVGRLRNEVLGLTTAYLGFYQAIQQIGGVLDTFKMMEAAQNRLGAVFNQNKQAVAAEMGFIQRQADRLKISMGDLADNYSKFAISAQGANFSSKGTKDIFISIAEAARVNKLSTQQTSDVFLAFTQMMNKGKIQAEELTQQLGERMPGAVNLVAKALGLTTAQLSKLMEQGQVFATEDTMRKIAEQMNAAFGPQLAESLQTTTSLIGEFFNNIQKGQMIIANGGFIEAFNRLLRQMNEYFQSSDGQKFFASLGVALGKATDLVAFFARHISAVITVVQALIALKLASWVRDVATAFTLAMVPALAKTTEGVTALATVGLMQGLRQALTATMTLIGGLVSSLATGVTGMFALRTAAISLGTAVAGVGAALSAIPAVAILGVIAYGVTSILGTWATGVDKATEAIATHEAAMQKILTLYDSVRGKAENWVDALTPDQKAMGLQTAQEEFRKTKEAYDELYKTVTANGYTNGRVYAWAFWEDGIYKAVFAINELKDKMNQGNMTVAQFKQGLQSIYNNTTSSSAREFLETMIKQVQTLEELNTKNGRAAVAANELGSVWQDVKDKAAQLGITVEQMSGAIGNNANAMDLARAAAERYGLALQGIMGLIPKYQSMAAQMAAQQKVDAFKVQIAGMPANTDEEKARVANLKSLLAEAEKSVELIGTKTRVATSVGTPAGDNARDLTQVFGNVSAQLGVASDDLLKAAYTLTNGKMDKESVIAAFKAAGVDANSPNDAIAKSIVSGLKAAGANEGTNIFGIVGAARAGNAKVTDNANSPEAKQIIADVEAASEASKATADAYKDVFGTFLKAGEQAGQGYKKTSEQIDSLNEKIGEATAQTPELKKQLAINQAIATAKKNNANISEEELQIIREQTGKLFDLNQATKKQGESNKEIKAVMREVNNLESARNDLLQVRKYYEDTGQLDKMKAIDGRLADINKRLEESIDKAIAMWKAIGGDEAEAAIAKLEATKTKLHEVGQKSKWTGQQFNESIANGLTNALDTFFDALDDGESIIGALSKAFRKFASDFLIEIGKMIIKQALLNALQAGGGANGGVGGMIASAIGALFHDGGVVGSGGMNRAVSASTWEGAVRYHEGGVAGLKPGEVPAILKKGEVVDPGDGSVFKRVFGDGPQGPAAEPKVKIVNAIDSGSFVSEGLNTDVGGSAILNHVRSNQSDYRSALGIV